ncbi:MAG: nitroreductase family protein [Chitinophagaceae bacterium]|nr:MAG: nitroreductase family protein [Chitinophagaceae bacterium]
MKENLYNKHLKENLKNMLKKIIKTALPKSIYEPIKVQWQYFKFRKGLILSYRYDYNRYLVNSDTPKQKSKTNLLSLIIRQYHVIEKGLTMPETKLGFGKGILADLILNSIEYIKCYDKSDIQIKQALSVIKEYTEFHINKRFQLDTELLNQIAYVEDLFYDDNKAENINCYQKILTKESYFSKVNSSFSEFAKSRLSIRNYTDEDISIENMTNALKLAQTTPSACNRQTWRTYLISNKKDINDILTVQGGNRGFGHLANKLIVVTADTSFFCGSSERNQVFVDGGIYAMNLLYSLHFFKIAACILNCSNTIEKDRKLRELCKIKESEVFIAMISCGIPPENFKAAASPRYNLENTNFTQ